MRPTSADTARYWTPTPADLPHVPAVAAHYWESARAPHRQWLVDAIATVWPVASVLDLGCQCGPNLRVLQHCFPSLALTGVDINAAALALGRTWLPTATFCEGTLPEALRQWGPGSVDVVVSTYSLAYQDPDGVVQTLAECLRIARRAVILIEPVVDAPQEVRCEANGYVEWRHDYAAILRDLLTDPRWPAEIGIEAAWLARERYDTLTGLLLLTPARRVH